MQPIVISYHLIWTGYGWWLPNDPRGSSTHCIRNDVVAELGELHHGRRHVQPARGVLQATFARSADRLQFPRQEFTRDMVASIAAGFAGAVSATRYTCYACAIMPDHVHLVIRKHRDSAETMIRNLQRESHLRLRADGHFDLQHPVWGGHGWTVFLDEPKDVWRTIEYVRMNPLAIGAPEQVWPFVTPYDNWPLHSGHNPNTPYAKRLRGR